MNLDIIRINLGKIRMKLGAIFKYCSNITNFRHFYVSYFRRHFYVGRTISILQIVEKCKNYKGQVKFRIKCFFLKKHVYHLIYTSKIIFT